ncbi:hypothetical protein D4764_16G0010110 [Takifugu flavidus]|uniref:Uncharacterized protein n=1 Tax=Takifugu flavidus TaxID=433684 RepID=A0A5C6NYD6_9TELE|nr:hypothetical protein D4764_16G0010110 [Takifugu flavidus]
MILPGAQEHRVKTPSYQSDSLPRKCELLFCFQRSPINLGLPPGMQTSPAPAPQHPSNTSALPFLTRNFAAGREVTDVFITTGFTEINRPGRVKSSVKPGFWVTQRSSGQGTDLGWKCAGSVRERLNKPSREQQQIERKKCTAQLMLAALLWAICSFHAPWWSVHLT